jgi:predicted amidohydrolase YtcJ
MPRQFRGAARRRPPPNGPADLVLLNARVPTMDPARPEAEVLAIAGDQVLASGTELSVERTYVGGQPVFDPKGAALSRTGGGR